MVKEKLLKLPDQKHDVGWAAGFFEGEGHVKAAKRGKYRWFAIEIAQVHREPLDKFQEIFGGKVYGPYGPYSTNRQSYYQYVAYSTEARDAIDAMMPFLFHKGVQAEIALKEMEQYVQIQIT